MCEINGFCARSLWLARCDFAFLDEGVWVWVCRAASRSHGIHSAELMYAINKEPLISPLWQRVSGSLACYLLCQTTLANINGPFPPALWSSVSDSISIHLLSLLNVGTVSCVLVDVFTNGINHSKEQPAFRRLFMFPLCGLMMVYYLQCLRGDMDDSIELYVRALYACLCL